MTWQDDAACRGAEAKAICAGCSVRVQCLDYAMREYIRHGIWGGQSDRQRRANRKAAA